MPEPTVHQNTTANQFEWHQDGETAVLTYRLEPDSITFLHTGVPEDLEGQGIASKLAIAGLKFAREKALPVIPLCPFVTTYIKRHQEYLELVHQDYRERLTKPPE